MTLVDLRFFAFGSRLRRISAIGIGGDVSKLRRTASNWVFGTLGISVTKLLYASGPVVGGYSKC